MASSEGELADITRSALERELANLRLNLGHSNQAVEALRREASEARQARDWAEAERAKALQEREALMSLCQSLRQARDEAVSNLADQLHDVNGNNPSPSHSADSAIDLAEWETEQIEVDGGDWDSGELGVELSGGRGESPATSSPIYVKAVAVSGRLHGILRPHDIVMEVRTYCCHLGLSAISYQLFVLLDDV